MAPQMKVVPRMAAILAQKDIGVNWVTVRARSRDIRKETGLAPIRNRQVTGQYN